MLYGARAGFATISLLGVEQTVAIMPGITGHHGFQKKDQIRVGATVEGIT
jgi:hypothetical protein